MSVVFLAFATSQVSFIKLFGIGLSLAIVMDAFVIRGTLVPAFMRLAGDLNWWAPKFLRRLHDRVGISEHVDLAPITVPVPDRVPSMATTNGRPRRDRPLVAAGREKIKV